MKRAFLVTSGTIAGLVGVLSYTPPQMASLATTEANEAVTPEPTSPSTQSLSPSSTPTPSQSQAPEVPIPTTPHAPTPTPTPTRTSNTRSGTFDGETIQTRWGPVQVQISVEAGKITSVSALSYPYGDRRSQMISSYSIPQLQRQTLAAQSANIDGVAGASYTTYGWVNSLRSALNRAGL